MAFPTSVGKGSRLRWPLLPRTLTCPRFQSMSSSSRDATSPERNPNRASKSKMAVSPVPSQALLSTLIAFVCVYAVFITAFLIFTFRIIRRGPVEAPPYAEASGSVKNAFRPHVLDSPKRLVNTVLVKELKEMDLPLLSAFFLAFTLTLYVILDGFDLGVGYTNLGWQPRHERKMLAPPPFRVSGTDFQFLILCTNLGEPHQKARMFDSEGPHP
jgi:hypothetical protein